MGHNCCVPIPKSFFHLSQHLYLLSIGRPINFQLYKIHTRWTEQTTNDSLNQSNPKYPDSISSVQLFAANHR
ncbi:hypothetical protein ES332_A13G149700v1 [Gossypium tomentosum]|uniref:Uncharacterized protein n=1 Tax=Gossypium tomentosum TaxID=34277 RepID=A0A5D2MKQ4_GOSTO|nr:hypothetical protein ES332_A13G149700v1 [Gossypium tomentosum]